MINIKIKDKSGIKLLTKDKFCDDDINVTLDENLFESGGSSSEEYPNESIKYYKQNRNKNYPYFPLPYEMEETQDTIYMLYDANGYMCCPAFRVTFTECVCTIQKYNNTTLVNEYVESITSGTTKYLQFSEEDSDYNTYNYIVIKLQGSITKHYLDYKPKFNDVEYSSNSSSDLLEVSGKCNSCDIEVINANNVKYHQKLEYYSFIGVKSTIATNMFSYCSSLKTIPQLDTSNMTNMGSMFNGCYSLQTIPQLDTSNVTSTSGMFSSCYSLKTIPLLNTSLVTNMGSMFNNCSSLQTIPQLDTSNVTDMGNIFRECSSLQAIPQLDTSKVTSMRYMFYNCCSLQAIPLLNTSNVTDTLGMFYGCSSLQTIPQLNTSIVGNMSGMFQNCYSLQTIPQLDTSLVTNMGNMFNNCYSLQTIPLLNTSLVTSTSGMFSSCYSLKTIPQLNTSIVGNMSGMFYNCYMLLKLDIINMKVSFSLSNSTMLTQSEIVKILNNLATVTTTQTLTLGSTNLAKLTEEQKAIATNKGWSLA